MVSPVTCRCLFDGICIRRPSRLVARAIGVILLGALLAAWPAVSPTLAATFPAKPITIIIYTKQGGPIDLTARRFVKIAAKYTDATFVVEYKTGAGGVIAMEHVLQSRPDGHTLMACTKSNVAKMVSTGREWYASQFDWIAMLMTDPECVITRHDSPTTQWSDLVRDGRNRLDEQIWGGPSRGGLDHVTAMQIWDRFDVRARWIPYEGGDQALQALLTGQLMAYVGNPADATGQPDLRVSIVSSQERLAHLPDTPTFGEFGFAELDELYMWRGFALRKGCPTEAKAWYDDLFQEVTNDPEWQSMWERDGSRVMFLGEDDFTRIVEENRQEFRRYLERLDLLPDAQVSETARWFAQPTARILMLLMGAHLVTAIIFARRKLWNRYGDRVIVSALLSISLVLLWETTHFPTTEGARAAAVPRLWMAIIGVMSIASLRISRQMFAAANVKSLNEARLDLVAKLALILILSIGLMLYAGYYVSTAVLLVAAMMLLGERRWPMLLSVTWAWLVFAYFVFSKFLFVPLPRGSWFESFV